ncbi:hypothetical protein PLICRDRAFT_37578 [Plicaturopsis crispa FD-325 SS-3]|nr:hypothetical protein PLICRDRAFT_37578 [Plicaturopsis crispa FD-325 SS-3]
MSETLASTDIGDDVAASPVKAEDKAKFLFLQSDSDNDPDIDFTDAPPAIHDIRNFELADSEEGEDNAGTEAASSSRRRSARIAAAAAAGPSHSTSDAQQEPHGSKRKRSASPISEVEAQQHRPKRAKTASAATSARASNRRGSGTSGFVQGSVTVVPVQTSGSVANAPSGSGSTLPASLTSSYTSHGVPQGDHDIVVMEPSPSTPHRRSQTPRRHPRTPRAHPADGGFKKPPAPSKNPWN